MIVDRPYVLVISIFIIVSSSSLEFVSLWIIIKCFFLHILDCFIISNSLIKKLSAKGGSKKINSNLSLMFSLFINEIVFSLKISEYYSISKLWRFFFSTSRALLSFSTKVVFIAPREIHSMPNEPTPE